MKKHIKFIALTLIFALLLTFCSCDTKEQPETDLVYTVYELNCSDMVSFYMTSSLEDEGKWEYEFSDMSCFKIFETTESESEFGLFGMGGTASYKTLILQPVAVGHQEVNFRLGKSGLRTFELTVTADKDNSDILRIKVEEVKKS